MGVQAEALAGMVFNSPQHVTEHRQESNYRRGLADVETSHDERR
jgi:hypothetical protein